MEYPEDLISIYRKKIYDFLKDYEGDPIVIEGVPQNLLKQILFDTYPTYYDNVASGIAYRFCPELDPVLEKIDLRNVRFDKFNINGANFSKLKNVFINSNDIDFSNMITCYFDGVYFTGEIVPEGRISNLSFRGSKNAQLNLKTKVFLLPPFTTYFLTEVDFCDSVFISPIPDHAEIFHCNFEGSRGAIINLNESYIFNTILYDATVYGNFDLSRHERITPSIEEIKMVYGDVKQPTLIRKKDFN